MLNVLSLRISKLSNGCLEARLGWPKEVFEKRKLTQIEALLQQNCKKFWDAIHKLDREVPGRVVGTSVPVEVVLADEVCNG